MDLFDLIYKRKRTPQHPCGSRPLAADWVTAAGSAYLDYDNPTSQVD